MAISKITALELYSNHPDDISTGAVKDIDSKKWAGYIYLLRDGEIHKVMLSTDPLFDTQQEAVSYMDDCRDRIVNFMKKRHCE